MTAVSALRNGNQTQNVLPADPTEVISLLKETGMTKHQYLLVRNLVNSQILLDFFPSYQCFLSSKKDKYPENISVDESYAEVKLQSLLNNTASSILELQSNVIETIADNSFDYLVLLSDPYITGQRNIEKKDNLKLFPSVNSLLEETS